MTISNYAKKPEEERNEYREELLDKLTTALDLQKLHKDEYGNSPYDKDVRKAITDLMIESSKEALAERAYQTIQKDIEARKAAAAEEKEKQDRLEKLKKQDEERTPYLTPLPNEVPSLNINSHRKQLIESNTRIWIQKLELEQEKFWKEKDDKFRKVYDRLLLETRERLLLESQNPAQTDAEYDDLAKANNAESNVVMLPSNKVEEAIVTEVKLSLWKRFKLWLISKLQD